MSSVVTFSLYRFDGWADKVWALFNMPVSKLALRRVPGASFTKMMGTGGGAGFSWKPNYGVYAMLCEWPSVETAEHAFANAPIFQRYRSRALETATLFLEPVSARGTWDGHVFSVPGHGVEQARPVIAMTRATLRLKTLLSFWRRVGRISDDAEVEAEQHFMIGTGELPWVRQVTFSVWASIETMERFARKSASHGEAARLAFARGWFRESCFMRFNLVKASGTWPGLDDLVGCDRRVRFSPDTRSRPAASVAARTLSERAS
ncbi:spheroidene monooxygenase [Roseibium aquae]|uniref:Spheroidene monooxygenase n=1 Tax=Roseibium aquae TaxID=1323746 RepID=A0A916T8D7_9HYPH|nr:spheroidene monooxygenase [Roseibium aquae]GGB33784.1 spheroidene monooxygenase [Roseibium aquae]